ncbi:hypothetical protein LCGC14_1451670 [marine sediment metagenome]|uniref:Uncharacterized protein n=1 Tax=marine sediment metagenome TaxID=412755 RepID=A0A0F9JIF8_9ZZZZ
MNENGPSILVIEDNKLQADAAMLYLKGLGYTVHLAPDGKSALKMLLTEAVDVALLDLELPDMHGTKILQWIKSNHSTKRVCVIIVTAQDSLGDKVMGLEAGAVDYLIKPFDETELQARIRSCLRTQSLQDELEQKNFQLSELVEEVKKMAITDPLTGLYNRRHMNEVLSKEFQKAKRYGGNLSCLMVDIDHFKRINDIYGHAVGDTVLKEVAETLTNSLRKVDIVARWGGEEFVILLPATGLDQAREAAERVLEDISNSRFAPIEDEQLTVSVGISSSSSKKLTTEDMIINTADEALLEAKRNGRNRMEVYAT